MYLGLGSNIDPEKNLRDAALMLRKAFKGIRFSSLYRSAAQHITDQAEFLNATAVFETKISPQKIVVVLKKIEKKLKKNTRTKFGPRTIDLDLLLYGQEISLEEQLTIPHLRLHTRRFVLEPLIELGAGEVNHPGFDRKLSAYLRETKKQHCVKAKLKAL